MHSTHAWGHNHRMLLLAAAALVTGLFLRVAYLDSDPRYPLWAGYVTDEGRWTEQARSIVLFGAVNIDSWLSRIHLVLSPLFQALATVSFSLFGVSFSSARLVSAVCGGALLIASFLFLRRRFTPGALFFSMVALAVQPDLVFLSRVAIPETPAMLFEFLAFAALISAPRTATKAAIAGLFTGAALGMKATVAPIVAIFVAVLAGTQRAGDPTSLGVRLSTYLGVLIAPAIATLGVATLLTDDGWARHLTGSLYPLAGFLQPAPFFTWFSFLFYDDFVPSLNLFLLGAWIIAGLLIAVGRLPAGGATTVYVGSAIWVAGWVAVSACLAYFPQRYVFHVLVPLILHLGAGLTLLQTQGCKEILKALPRLSGLRRVVVVLWLSLPLAVLLCPSVIGIADLSGFAIDRFREQAPLLLVLYVAVALVLQRSWRSEAVAFAVVVLPLVVLLLWFAGVQSGIIDHAFWDVADATTLLTWIVLLALAATITVLVHAQRARSNRLRQFGYAYLAAFMAIWLGQTLPSLAYPSYTIAEASAELERLVDESTTVGTGRAASLFLGNELRYTEELNERALPEMLVVAFDKVNSDVLAHYRLVEQHDLRLDRDHRRGVSPDATLKIYRRRR